MFEDALVWAEEVLAAPITRCSPLRGGLTSTMLALTDAAGRESVLRLMTEEPWRAHGAGLTRREQRAQQELATTAVPAPETLALDPDGLRTGVAAHLMTRLPGAPADEVGKSEIHGMAQMAARIHAVEPTRDFRPYQSWAPAAKWRVPPWTEHPGCWQRAFEILASAPPAYVPVFLHRDFSHRNLLWRKGSISGVVDWVETSMGPAWLDVAHGATNLAVSFGTCHARLLVEHYAAVTGTGPDPYWFVMDAVGFLPFPGASPLFGSQAELAGLDRWLHHVIEEMPG